MTHNEIETIRQADADLAAAQPLPFPLSSRGLESFIAGGFIGIEKTDWVFPGLRERVGAVLRNCPTDRLVDGHAGARPYRVAPVSTSPSTRLLQACGVAMVHRDEAVLCFIGQGAAATGNFYEALNLAALHELNLIVLARTQDLSGEESPLATQVADDLASKAKSFGIRSTKVDGTNFEAVVEAVSAARQKGGPHLIEAAI